MRCCIDTINDHLKNSLYLDPSSPFISSMQSSISQSHILTIIANFPISYVALKIGLPGSFEFKIIKGQYRTFNNIVINSNSSPNSYFSQASLQSHTSNTSFIPFSDSHRDITFDFFPIILMKKPLSSLD